MKGDNTILKYKQVLLNNKPTTLAKWGILLLLLLIYFLSFLYGDIITTTEHSFILLKSSLEGDFFGFYKNAIEIGQPDFPAVYGITLYIIFAICKICNSRNK